MNLMRGISQAALLGAALLIASCQRPAADADTNTTLAAPRFGTWGVDLSGRASDVAPGEDFFRHAVGGAYDRLTIPSDRASWGVAEELIELSNTRLQAIIEEAANAASPSGETAQVGGLFKSFMDEAQIETLDATPIKEDLDKVRAADTHVKLAELMGEGMSSYYGLLFGFFVGVDQRAPDQYTVYVNMAGLGLPDRDYYLDARFAQQKQAYRNYVAQMLTLMQWPDADAAADAILAYETRIAEVSWPRAERRDDVKMYNARTIEQLQAEAPGFPWTEFLKAAKLEDQQRVVVGEVTAFPAAAKIFADTPIATLQAWQAFNLGDQTAPYLSNRFVDAQFAFRGRELSGIEENRSRVKRGIAAVNSHLGETVGKLYVEKYFPPSSKIAMEQLVANLRTALSARLKNNDWMSDATKAEAQRKLDAINVKIGYPDRWRDYSALHVEPGDLYGNIRRSIEFQWNFERNKLGKPIDRDEWFMNAHEVNAYYDSTQNEIVFPAGILQPPFFDPDADAAVNYGGIGAVIGHEITHGFDDQGRKSDATGLLRDWWTSEDAERFQARAQVLGAQFARFEPVPDHFINPDLTMGENIADLGGVLIAYDAYHTALDGKPAPMLDGLNGDERFFLAYAQSWLGKRRPEALIRQLASDPPFAEHLSRERHRAECRCVLRSVWHQPRCGGLHCTGGAGEDLVAGGRKLQRGVITEPTSVNAFVR
jgi:putative endopeptidase